MPNHTTRVCPVGDLRNAIYIRCTINGRSTLCLRDTGSEVSLAPLSIVQGLPLQPTNRVLLAANATAIQVQGKLNIPVKMCRRFLVSTDFLVSDQMTDAIGYDDTGAVSASEPEHCLWENADIHLLRETELCGADE